MVQEGSAWKHHVPCRKREHGDLIVNKESRGKNLSRLPLVNSHSGCSDHPMTTEGIRVPGERFSNYGQRIKGNGTNPTLSWHSLTLIARTGIVSDIRTNIRPTEMFNNFLFIFLWGKWLDTGLSWLTESMSWRHSEGASNAKLNHLIRPLWRHLQHSKPLEITYWPLLSLLTQFCPIDWQEMNINIIDGWPLLV